ncbi:MAG: hypothetical protein ABSC15_24160 [Terriglobales bacterium]|jgi:hypothetical protein
MKRQQLLTRLDRLEAVLAVKQVGVISYGWLNMLRNYEGERHVVLLRREPTISPGLEWCEWEERPGPAPSGAEDVVPNDAFREDDRLP